MAEHLTLYLYAELDILGIFILMVLYFCGKNTRHLTFDQRLYNYLLFINILILITDCLMWLLNGATFPGAVVVNMLDNSLYFFATAMMGFVWLLYCDYKIIGDYAKTRRHMIWYILPLLACAALLIINASTDIIFYYDQLGVYHRGPLLPVFSGVTFIYPLVGSILILQQARQSKALDRKREFYTLAAFPLPVLLGGIFQSLVYGLPVVWLCSVVALLIVFINVQNMQISTDPLTGLNNRRQFNKHLTDRFSDPSSTLGLYAIMIDIDNFKGINDTLGHREGDKALVQSAHILKMACAGKNTFLARIGGDEFCIVGQDIGGQAPLALMEHIRRQVEEFNADTEAGYRLSFSQGLARYGEGGVTTVDELLSAADKEMYQAKSKR